MFKQLLFWYDFLFFSHWSIFQFLLSQDPRSPRISSCKVTLLLSIKISSSSQLTLHLSSHFSSFAIRLRETFLFSPRLSDLHSHFSSHRLLSFTCVFSLYATTHAHFLALTLCLSLQSLLSFCLYCPTTHPFQISFSAWAIPSPIGCWFSPIIPHNYSNHPLMCSDWLTNWTRSYPKILLRHPRFS